MTTPEQVQQAQAAVALTRYLADHPKADDQLLEELLDSTSVEALAYLAAAMARCLSGADAFLATNGQHLADQSLSERTISHGEEAEESPKAPEPRERSGLAAHNTGGDSDGDQSL